MHRYVYHDSWICLVSRDWGIHPILMSHVTRVYPPSMSHVTHWYIEVSIPRINELSQMYLWIRICGINTSWIRVTWLIDMRCVDNRGIYRVSMSHVKRIYHTSMSHATRFHAATHCNTLRSTAYYPSAFLLTHCIMLSLPFAVWPTSQFHTAPHCIMPSLPCAAWPTSEFTLQHTATHSIMLCVPCAA